MPNRAEYRFPPFRLVPADMRLFRGDAPLPLRPKTFAVLLHLVEQAGRLVTKQALIDAVWPDVAVGDDVLKGCIRELREALGDDSARASFIQTAHRRGYRFIAQLEAADAPSCAPPGQQPPMRQLPLCVGREAQLARLEAALGEARAGARRCVFVVGEAGSGKTTLIARFVAQAGARVLHGQCIDQFGASEPLLPILDAFSELARAQPELAQRLDQTAPRWRSGATAGPATSSAGSMLRELADAVEALTAAQGLVLVVEDMHWCDPTTLALLSLLASRPSASPLLILGSFRPLQASGPSALLHATHELEQRGRASRLELGGFTPQAVSQLLCERLGAARAEPEVSALLHARTGGSPMFVSELAAELQRRGALEVRRDVVVLGADPREVAQAVPESLRSMLSFSLARLDITQRAALEVLALAAVALPASAVATVTGAELLDVERDCERLCEPPRALTREPAAVSGETRYGLVHALFRDVVAESVPGERAVQLHRLLAQALSRRPELLGRDASHVLALHFERAREPEAAAGWLATAAEQAAERHAARESLALAEHGLGLLAGGGAPGDQLRLLLCAGNALIELQGFGAEALARTFERAQPLAEAIADDKRRAEVFLGLRAYHAMRDLRVAFQLCQKVQLIAERIQDPGLLLYAYSALGDNTFCRGELQQAELHYAQAEAVTSQLLAAGVPGARLGIGINAARKSLSRYIRGYPVEAVQLIALAVADPGASADPFQRALVLIYAGFLYLMRREPELAAEHASAALQIAERDGFRYWLAAGHVILGSSQAERGQLGSGIEHMRHGIALWREIGARVLYPSFVAELGLALAKQGARDEALQQLREARAMVRQSGEAVLMCELLRLEGEWLIESDRGESARLLDQALAVARQQGARAFELRILTTRVHHEIRHGTPETRSATRRALGEVLAHYGAGLDLPDLRDARAALG